MTRENKFQVGDEVKNRWIVAINGMPQRADTVTWVSKDGQLLQIDFGDGEILTCRASDYELAE